MRFDCYVIYFRPFLTSKSDLKIVQKSVRAQTLKFAFKFSHLFEQKQKHVQKLSKKGPKTGGSKWWNFGREGPLDPRLIPDWSQRLGICPWGQFGPQNDLKMTLKWNLFSLRNHRNPFCDLRVWWNRKSRPKGSQKKLARVPSMQIAFFRGETAAQKKAHRKIGELEKLIEKLARVPSL